MERVTEALGIQGVTTHTLRHTWATRLIMAGVDQRTVMELGGWSDFKMVTRYTHPTPDHKKAALERLCQEPPTPAGVTTLPKRAVAITRT